MRGDVWRKGGKSETRLKFEPKTFKGRRSLEYVAIDWKKNIEMCFRMWAGVLKDSIRSG